MREMGMGNSVERNMASASWWLVRVFRRVEMRALARGLEKQFPRTVEGKWLSWLAVVRRVSRAVE